MAAALAAAVTGTALFLTSPQEWVTSRGLALATTVLAGGACAGVLGARLLLGLRFRVGVGNVLPATDFGPLALLLSAMALLLPYLRRYRMTVAFGLGSMLLSLGFSRLIPWILKLGIDALGAGADHSKIAGYAGVLVGAAALGGVFLYLQRWLIIGTSRRIAE